MRSVLYLLWNKSRINVHSVQEIDKVLDKLISEIEDGTSHGIQLVANDKTGLLITIGSTLSHIEFYSSDVHPPVVGYFEDTDDEELFYFHYEGELSSVKKRSCVSIEKARETMRLYFLTGEKPTNIAWQR